MKKLLAVLLLVCLCASLLAGCQENLENLLQKGLQELENAQVDEDLYKKIQDVENILKKLPAGVKDGLEDLEILDKAKATWEKYANEESQKLEELIAQLPDEDQITEASAETIEKVRKAYAEAGEDIRNRIDNLDILEAAEEALKKAKNG